MKKILCVLCIFLSWIIDNCSAIKIINPCPYVSLENGRSRVRGKGRTIKFTCYDGFTLIGNKYSTCVQGKWDTPTPICVNSNCPELPKPEHGLVASTNNGAVLMYFCESGYELIGSKEIYCNGKQWSSSAPFCRETNALPPTSCDFEKPDLCWWEQDPIHDFDWTRYNLETPSSNIGTGPLFDHTFGHEHDGYYLYIEASGKMVNDKARIISPLYNSSLTENGCFSFWYHMFGASIGTLNVYFRQENKNNSTGNLMFSRSGEQGDKWLHGIFKLPPVETNFQIIIEGVRGKSYVSDIAIDDVALLKNEKCNETVQITNVTAKDDEQVEIFHSVISCNGKCSNSYLGTPPPSFATEICYCTIDCSDYSLCCPDYYNYCFNDSVTDGVDTTTLQSKKPSGIDMTTFAVPRHVIPINSTDGIDPTILREMNLTTTLRTTTVVLDVETPFSGDVQKATPNDSRDCESCYDYSNVIMHNTQHLLGHNGQLGLASIFGIVVGLLAAVAITAIAAFVILHRHKNYKRGNSSSGLSEDSDVRFLTSDEVLDFNLARPSSGDYDEM